MNELSPEARAFIDGAIAQERPPAEEKARIRAALAARVAAEPAHAPSAPGKLAGGSIKLFAGALAVIGAVALIRAMAPSPRLAPPPWTPPAPAPAPAAPVPAPPAAAPKASRPLRESTRTKPAPEAGIARLDSEPPARPPIDDSLQQELQLLSDAQHALELQQPERALSLLDEHAQRFPEGKLRPEREAAHVLALCALDRVDDARREAARFFAANPHSPLIARLRESCAGEDAPW